MTSWVAVVAFLCSVLGLWIAGIPMGIYAQREIDRSHRQLTGRGFATAAVVIGLIEVVLTIIALIFVLSVIKNSSS